MRTTLPRRALTLIGAVGLVVATACADDDTAPSTPATVAPPDGAGSDRTDPDDPAGSTVPVFTATTTDTPTADIDLSDVTLRVGDQVNFTKTALEAAGQADTPYRIEWATFSSGPPLLEALNADAIDIGGVGDTPPIFAAAGGAAIKVVLATRTPATTTGILVPGGSDITDVTGLAGRTVAVAPGSAAHWVLLKAIQGAGLTVADITVSYLQPAEALAAFEGGDVDAWAVWDPYTSLARQGGATFLVTGDEAGTQGLGFQVSSDQALARPETEAAIRDFLTRLRAAQAWQRDHKDEWAVTYSELTGLDLEIARSMQRNETIPLPIDDTVIAAQQEEADAFYDAELIPNAVEFAAVTDDRFNDIALTGA